MPAGSAIEEPARAVVSRESNTVPESPSSNKATQGPRRPPPPVVAPYSGSRAKPAKVRSCHKSYLVGCDQFTPYTKVLILVSPYLYRVKTFPAIFFLILA